MSRATFSIEGRTDDQPGWRARMLSKLIPLWLRHHRTRRHLSRLEDHRLPDIGLSAAESRAECQNWFWQK